ncbi:MAG: hypothetical protein WD403_15490, partial [Pirellulales bacterium]
METKNEPNRKPAEKKTPPVGTNMVWYFLAVGIGVTLLVTLLTGKPEADIPYLELMRLIKKGNPEDPRFDEKQREAMYIEVVEGSEGKRRRVRYSNLSDLKVGQTEISGKVMQQLLPEPPSSKTSQAETEPSAPKNEPKEVGFRSGRLGFADDNGALMNLLTENGFTQVRAEFAPSRLRDYFPLLLFFVLVVLFFVFVLRRYGGAGSPMAFGRSRGKMYAQEDIGVTFEDVAGVDEAVEELREVVEFLRTPE